MKKVSEPFNLTLLQLFPRHGGGSAGKVKKEKSFAPLRSNIAQGVEEEGEA